MMMVVVVVVVVVVMMMMMIIDIAIPDDLNTNTNKTAKLSQCKAREMAVGRLWKGRAKIGPIITGTLGTVKKGSDQNCQLLPGHRLVIELQNITLMSTAHCICNVLG